MYVHDFLNCILSYVCSERVCLHCAQVEKFARESDEWQSRATEWKSRHDAMEAEMRRERSRREAFERKIADMERVNDELRQERHVHVSFYKSDCVW